MRRTLAGVALAVTSMVALSFLIPLAMLVQSQARDRATTAAEQQAAALAPVLALTTRPSDVQQSVAGLDSAGQLGVHLPGGRLIGASHASAAELRQAVRDRETLAFTTRAGWSYLQPVMLPGNKVAVTEAFVPRSDLNHGVAMSWFVMSALALCLVAGSVAVADRLGARVVRSSQGLSRAANALGAGDLEIRVEPAGPPELKEAGVAFNAMADHVVQLLALERELVADLSHRLRTPLTALRLESERMAAIPGAERVTTAVDHLEAELDSIITAARTPLAVGPMAGATQRAGAGTWAAGGGSGSGARCEVSAAVGERWDFWSVLAAQQSRPHQLEVTSEPTPVALPGDEVAAMVDALIGNVFRHTPEGTAVGVRVGRTAQAVVLTVEDAGPGIEDPQSALARGVSVNGSTGLGLDIAHRAARAAGGQVRIGRGGLGGALVEVTLELAAGVTGRHARAGRRGRGRHQTG